MAKHKHGNSTIGAGQFGGSKTKASLVKHGNATKGAAQFGKGKKK